LVAYEGAVNSSCEPKDPTRSSSFTQSAPGKSFSSKTKGDVDATMIASGLTGPSLWRPAHLHFMVSADGCKPLTTHLFVKDAPHINEDARLSLLVILD